MDGGETSECQFRVVVHQPFSDHVTFVPIDSEACKQARNLQPEYNPMVQGQFSRRTTLNITPGHNIGDEDFFTNLSVMCAGLEKIRECHGEETWKSTRSGLSLVTGFLACLSQAHAVGFNMHEELRYPISSQTILTDGRTFEFSGYQLNTTQLWKPPSANRVSNVAFVNPREELYKDFEHGRVVGFNDNVLKTLLKYFLVKPTDLDGAELLNCVKPKGKSIANYGPLHLHRAPRPTGGQRIPLPTLTGEAEGGNDACTCVAMAAKHMCMRRLAANMALIEQRWCARIARRRPAYERRKYHMRQTSLRPGQIAVPAVRTSCEARITSSVSVLSSDTLANHEIYI
ncbi:RT30-like protein [Mya arenaria]|uniref:RT30-like protein n=1 Tax=Mya arenaria TaxID=6604 RepID=A0ABY7DN50_MYAAR|nr:RT30-like protein [Mya arenaria]